MKRPHDPELLALALQLKDKESHWAYPLTRLHNQKNVFSYGGESEESYMIRFRLKGRQTILGVAKEKTHALRFADLLRHKLWGYFHTRPMTDDDCNYSLTQIKLDESDNTMTSITSLTNQIFSHLLAGDYLSASQAADTIRIYAREPKDPLLNLLANQLADYSFPPAILPASRETHIARRNDDYVVRFYLKGKKRQVTLGITANRSDALRFADMMRSKLWKHFHNRQMTDADCNFSLAQIKADVHTPVYALANQIFAHLLAEDYLSSSL